MMRILVADKNINTFMHEMAWTHNVITDIHKDEDGTEFFIMPEQQGYAEPDSLYDKMSHCVEDIWHLTVGDSLLKIGEDESIEDAYVWHSCKRQYEENLGDDD